VRPNSPLPIVQCQNNVIIEVFRALESDNEASIVLRIERINSRSVGHRTSYELSRADLDLDVGGSAGFGNG
jgi:hypothetical protein